MECLSELKNNQILSIVVALVGVGIGASVYLGNNSKYVLMGVGGLLVLVVILAQLNLFQEDEVESFDAEINQANNIPAPIDDDTESELEDEEEMDVPQSMDELNSNNSDNINRSEPLGQNEEYKSVEGELKSRSHLPNDCYPKDVLSPEELLPRDVDSVWAQSVPAGQGSLGDKNFLNAGFHVGVNTVGQSLRNANRQIRSEPPNPQIKVSPWMQTTIEFDTNRKPLEIGA